MYRPQPAVFNPSNHHHLRSLKSPQLGLAILERHNNDNRAGITISLILTLNTQTFLSIFIDHLLLQFALSSLSINFASTRMAPTKIPERQTVALVRELGGPVEFVDDYPVQKPGLDEVLAKVLYTGVCQSGMHHQTFNIKSIVYDFHSINSISQTFIPAQAQPQDPTASPSQQSNCLTSAATKASAASSP